MSSENAQAGVRAENPLSYRYIRKEHHFLHKFVCLEELVLIDFGGINLVVELHRASERKVVEKSHPGVVNSERK